MSSFLRPLSNTSAAAARSARQLAPIRYFHSPYVILGQTPRKVQSQKPASEVSNPFAVYEKQYDFSYEPLTSTFGHRTYVVSQPDASASHYEVPSGAYPTSSPYVNFAPTEAPNTKGAQVSSASFILLAHEFMMRTVPQHFGGVGASSAVIYAIAPGEMGEQEGNFGGLAMMDKEGTTPGEGELAERNPPPDCEVAEVFSKAGLRDGMEAQERARLLILFIGQMLSHCVGY